MRALQFIFIALFTFLQLLFYLHSSIVSYVEQQYHNFSESENVAMQFLGSVYSTLYLKDNFLFATSDMLMSRLESLRVQVFGTFDGINGETEDMIILESSTDSSKNNKSPHKPTTHSPTHSTAPHHEQDSRDTSLDEKAESSTDSKPYDSILQESNSQESSPQDSNPQKSNPIEAVLKNIATTGDSAPTLPKDLQDLSNLPTSNPQTESTLDFSKPFPQDLSNSTPPSQPPPQPIQESYTPIRSINNPRIQVSEGEGILLVGDSMMQGVAPYLLRTFKKAKIQGINLSKHSTGLTYKHYFNWEVATRDALEKNPHISLVVVLLGANDPWSMKKNIAFKSPLWEEIYTQRIDEILQVAQGYGVRVAWYEVPSVREKSLNDKIMYLNTLYEAAVKQSGEYFLQSNGIVTQGGKYSAFIKNAKGKSVQVRADDGVHFTARGYQIMANILLNNLEVLPLENTSQESKEELSQGGVE